MRPMPLWSWLKSRRIRRSELPRRRAVAARGTRLEVLERREVLSITSAVIGTTLSVSSDAADAIAITCVGGSVKINGADPGAGLVDCTAIDAISVVGGPGANLIDLSGVTRPDFMTVFPAFHTLRVTVDGAGGDDTIIGSQFDDTLAGGAGADSIIGGVGLDEREQDQSIPAGLPCPALVPASAPNTDTAVANASSTVTLTAAEVCQLIRRAAAASASTDAIIAVVDREGHILGVRTESSVPTADADFLTFAIDGAVAEARTAAFFANVNAPLTSRTIQFISQTTITQREVDSNPNVDPVAMPTVRGPGFVAEIGLHGHFPPGVAFTPQVDLFAIEHTNRDSIVHPGADHVRGTADDVILPARFNIDPAFVPAGQEIDAPESYGFTSGLRPFAQSRGIGTLPGGIPIYKDSDGNGTPDEVVGGIGVFFPGPDGYASFEQDFGGPKSGINALKSLEAEFIAVAAVAGSISGPIGGVAPLPGIDVKNPRARLDLVGITLDTVGPGGARGLSTLLRFGKKLGAGAPDGGTNQPINVAGDKFASGEVVPEGTLVTPHAGGSLTAGDVTTIVDQSVAEANQVRAAIRLPLSSTTRMVIGVTDLNGNVLGLHRMPDSTIFSIDVAVAKARNVAYYADPGALVAIDRFDADGNGTFDVPLGTAFTARTFRFLALPNFPEGIDAARPGAFSILNDAAACVDPRSLATLCPIAAASFTSVVGHDAFNPGTNFRDLLNIPNQSGIVFFPGSSPVYKAGVLAGGFGISGDGVDQDDVVTFAGAKGLLPPEAIRADQFKVRGVRLPFVKFLRNPKGLK